LARTLQFPISDDLIGVIAERLHQAVARIPADAGEKWLGVLVLARPEESSLFHYARPTGPNGLRHLGESRLRPGQLRVPHHERLLEQLWMARVAEGAEQGRRPGTCDLTGQGDEAIAPYCKVWPWAFLTWTCPLPHAGSADLLVEGMGLSDASYRALTAGA